MGGPPALDRTESKERRQILLRGGLTIGAGITVQGGTGNVSMRGGLFFSASDHTHTGIGNTAGRAAIENDSGTYNALMILGRTVSTNPLKRVVVMVSEVGWPGAGLMAARVTLGTTWPVRSTAAPAEVVV